MLLQPAKTMISPSRRIHLRLLHYKVALCIYPKPAANIRNVSLGIESPAQHIICASLPRYK